MFGSIMGNFTAFIYFFYFQLAGLILASLLLKKEGALTKILLGSVIGSLFLQWIPVLLSFFCNFSFTAHILAQLLVLPILIWGFLKRKYLIDHVRNCPKQLRYHSVFLFTLAGFFILWAYLLHTLK